MSDTTSDNTPTQNPTPEPLTGLTDAQATLYTELVGRTEPATVSELALAAAVGKSTAGRALPLLEQRGLAVRTPGGHNGPCRMPDLWYPAPAHKATSTQDTEHAAVPVQSEPSADDTTEPANNATEFEGRSPDETAPDTAPSDTGNTGPCIGTESNTAQDDPSQDTEHGDGDDTSEDRTHREEDSSSAPTPQENSEPLTAPAPPAPRVEGRLAPGALRQMVINHLQAHPGEAFTATRISRVIEKSSGAIANALVTLVKQGIAEQASDRPRTYRLATPEGNG
ncbi:sugar-specific transcriptional regulator TrmB [Streptomyces sp. 2333.5]|uniref:helix-turn-helix domain-containing protein n=1 Tax=unclassified Streptomyces TaxID=2593676 RepID=UPI00089B50FA|nr:MULTISPECIES: helix-turn-helix domain-containing protein [unclassified Streptomyces]PJJ04204.1 sugar-specific transcriptional regulator TrmB [Streptomyces sp. 2333.5]SEE71000.1 Sugar-specific transcriptional regulator TrmB [Streptomyces sp. 2112.2]